MCFCIFSLSLFPPPFLAALKRSIISKHTHTHTHTTTSSSLALFLIPFTAEHLCYPLAKSLTFRSLLSLPCLAAHMPWPCNGSGQGHQGPTCSLVRITFPSSSNPDHALPPEIPSTYIFLVSWFASSLSGCSLEPSRTDSPFTAHPFTGGCRPHGSLCLGPWLIPPVYSSWKGSSPSARSEHPACSPAPCCLPDVPLDCLTDLLISPCAKQLSEPQHPPCTHQSLFPVKTQLTVYTLPWLGPSAPFFPLALL